MRRPRPGRRPPARSRPGSPRRRSGTPARKRAGDALDDPDGEALLLEDGPLLDVELEIGLQLGPRTVGGEDALGGERRLLQDVGERQPEGGPTVPDLLL